MYYVCTDRPRKKNGTSDFVLETGQTPFEMFLRFFEVSKASLIPVKFFLTSTGVLLSFSRLSIAPLVAHVICTMYLMQAFCCCRLHSCPYSFQYDRYLFFFRFWIGY